MLWSTRHLFFGKVSEVHKNSIRSSQKRLFPQFRGVLGPMRSQRPHVAKSPRKTPRNRSHRRNSAVTTRGSAARTPRVARCRTKTSPNRSESGFLSPQTHGAAGRTTAEWGPATAWRGPKWHSPRLRRTPKRAPHRRKTHSEAKMLRDMNPEKELGIFRFDTKTFRKLFEATSCPRKTPRPKRDNRRNEAFRDFGPGPENGRPRETAEREELIRSPDSQKNGFWFRCVRWTRPKKARKRNFSATFRTSKKSDETPIFVAFRKFFKFPGSLSALPGLLISSLGVRKRAPYHPIRIYIYIYMYMLTGA